MICPENLLQKLTTNLADGEMETLRAELQDFRKCFVNILIVLNKKEVLTDKDIGDSL